MVKGDIVKKSIGYAVYKKPNSDIYKILSCHNKEGYKGWYWERNKGTYTRPGVNVVCHSTKALANKKLKSMIGIEPKEPKEVKAPKITKTWVPYKMASGEWGVKECLKHHKTVAGKRILIRLYANGTSIPKEYKCYTKKTDANKIAKNKNEKLVSKMVFKKAKGIKARTAKYIKTRKSAFGKKKKKGIKARTAKYIKTRESAFGKKKVKDIKNRQARHIITRRTSFGLDFGRRMSRTLNYGFGI